MHAKTTSFCRIITALMCVISLLGCSAENDHQNQDSLVYLVEDVPVGLDYDGPAAVLPTSQIGFVNLMDPLIDYQIDDTATGQIRQLDFQQFEGRLAESWSYDSDTLTWSFKLREGVISCAGNELTADDVLYTFARAKSVSGAAPIGWFLANVASIDGFDSDVLSHEAARVLGDEIEKTSKYEFTIRQSEPNQLFLPVLTTFGMLIFDSKAAKENATAADPWSHRYVNSTTAPGFGAYCLERWTPGDEFVLTANPKYHRGKPPIRRILFKRVPQSNNRFILMRMKQADLADRLTPREFLRLADFDHLRVSGVTGNENLFVHMNFKTPPFDNVLIRRAIAAAIPYNWIIRNGYFGQAKKWQALAPSSYPGGETGFQMATSGHGAAQELLTKAGYPGGSGLEQFADAFRLAYVAEKETTLGPIATAIRSALRSAGFPVELEPIPLTQYGDRQLVKKDLGFALNDQEKPAVVDAGYAVQLFFATSEAGGVNNMVNYASDRVDDLWLQARKEPDSEHRARLITEIYQQLAKDVAWLPVVEFETQWVSQTGVEGLVWYPDNALRFFNLRKAM